MSIIYERNLALMEENAAMRQSLKEQAETLAGYAQEVARQSSAIAQLEMERDRWKADYWRALDGEPVASCEKCRAYFFDGDDYVSDPGGVHGCWYSMTDIKSKRDRPCYAYRVDKADARPKEDGCD